MPPTQGRKRDNGFVDMRAKYVLRPRLSWTGLYESNVATGAEAKGEDLKQLGQRCLL